VTCPIPGSALGPELRPVSDADDELLYRIYASTRTDELAHVRWDAPTKEGFLRMQFAAQRAHYCRAYPEASYDVIVVDDEPIGRLYVDRHAAAIHVIDVALLPERRGCGIGTILLRRLIDEAEAVGRPARLHVERANPTRRLYERLGFRVIEDQGVYLLMERAPYPNTAS
jgi:GNAT superfamily N-acetyltransferase